ncbi:uncharacterized protein LOC143024367 [Oratosquilla oratoria]|uniref:uncharacterized protein LOC143024367 n=1 Tax=Oratosquilla oratoria TaxID=337810 RepID=UPI003F75DBBE
MTSSQFNRGCVLWLVAVGVWCLAPLHSVNATSLSDIISADDLLEDQATPEAKDGNCTKPCQFYDTKIKRCNYQFRCLWCRHFLKQYPIDVDLYTRILCYKRESLIDVRISLSTPCKDCYYEQIQQCLKDSRCQKCSEFFQANYGDKGYRLAKSYCP